jgi:hypothetical protein
MLGSAWGVVAMPHSQYLTGSLLFAIVLALQQGVDCAYTALQ